MESTRPVPAAIRPKLSLNARRRPSLKEEVAYDSPRARDPIAHYVARPRPRAATQPILSFAFTDPRTGKPQPAPSQPAPTQSNPSQPEPVQLSLAQPGPSAAAQAAAAQAAVSSQQAAALAHQPEQRKAGEPGEVPGDLHIAPAAAPAPALPSLPTVPFGYPADTLAAAVLRQQTPEPAEPMARPSLPLRPAAESTDEAALSPADLSRLSPSQRMQRRRAAILPGYANDLTYVIHTPDRRRNDR